ncbi:hypothetical protein PYR71_13355 [Rhizobium sp. MC63]|uniref:Uncharacterized protein n=1 Tax=Rhizobium mulingense TaxID=3031128 RepID=A0ACC6MYD2_9HYPH|nr:MULTISPECIES: hypothetical protein [unclassified Rhizobium]MDF0697474.1 hypothetical protein [Rhizobium sp. MC63]MEA3518322.1 hypothetical protein [Rhizobium sp. MJ31]
MFKVILAIVVALAYLYPLYTLWDQIPFLPYLVIAIVVIVIAWLATVWWLFNGTALQAFSTFIVSVIVIFGGAANLSGVHKFETLNERGQEIIDKAQ